MSTAPFQNLLPPGLVGRPTLPPGIAANFGVPQATNAGVPGAVAFGAGGAAAGGALGTGPAIPNPAAPAGGLPNQGPPPQAGLAQNPPPAAGPQSKTAPNGQIPPPGLDYSGFSQWWFQNGGSLADLPGVAEFNSGFLSNPIGSGSGGPTGTGPVNGAQDPNIPDVLGGQFDFNSPEAFQALVAGLAQGAFPGLQFSGRDAPGGKDRLNSLRQLGGGFSGGDFGLPGEEADATAGALFNILLNEASQQTGRQEQGQGILESLIAQLGGSPAQGLADQAAGAAGERIQPGSLDALRGSFQGQLDTGLAAERNAAINSAQDRGLLGQGAASTAALGGINNRLAGLRQQGNFDIEQRLDELTGQRIGQAAQTAPAAAQVTQALTQNPQLNLVNALFGQRNPQVGELSNFLQGVINAQGGQALANRGGSAFETVAPLAGSIIGALGGPIGSAIGGAIGGAGSRLPSSVGTGPSPGTFYT